jgi:hypothetical protein
MSIELHKEALEMALSLTCGALEKAGFEHIDNPADAIEVLAQQRDELLAALKRMDAMHDLMMKQVNHGASFYQSDCLHEMNAAPIQAARAIAKAEAA